MSTRTTPKMLYFIAKPVPGTDILEGLQVARFYPPLAASLWTWEGWGWCSQ